MTDYTNTFNGAAKDAANDTILGADHDTELDNISTAITSKSDKIIAGTSGNLIEQDGTGNLVDSGIDSADLDGITSPVQAQIDNKADRAAAASGHIRCGNVQIHDGEANIGTYDADANITEGVFETVGPTGSGAQNIWTAMNNIDSTATALLLLVEVELNGAAAGNVSAFIYCTNGNDSTPDTARTLFGSWSFEDDGGTVDNGRQTFYGVVPLANDNLDFRFRWDANNASTQQVTLHYRGFITD